MDACPLRSQYLTLLKVEIYGAACFILPNHHPFVVARDAEGQQQSLLLPSTLETSRRDRWDAPLPPRCFPPLLLRVAPDLRLFASPLHPSSNRIRTPPPHPSLDSTSSLPRQTQVHTSLLQNDPHLPRPRLRAHHPRPRRSYLLPRWPEREDRRDGGFRRDD